MSQPLIDRPFVGEVVLWHKTGRLENDPRVVVCSKTCPPTDERNQIDIDLPAAHYGEGHRKRGIPHITDTRLQNPDFAQESGGWELSDFGKLVRDVARRVQAMEVSRKAKVQAE